MKYLKYFFLVTCFVIIQQAVASQEASACFVRGLSQQAQCFTLSVPKLYTQENTDTRSIHVVKVNAKSINKNPPLFVLAGGPGQASAEMTPYINAAFHQVIKQHDIIFIDQRGSGQSLRLGCNTANIFETEKVEAALQSCRKTVMPYMAELTTETYAHDLEQVRQALGFDKVSLWGGSYGTFAAQAYASYYPDSVHVLLLDAVLALNANPLVNGGVYAQNSLQRLYQLCQQDKRCQQRFGNWPEQLLNLKAQFNESPTRLNADSKITGDELMHLVRSALYSPEISARLPLAIEQAVNDDLAMFNAISQATAGAASDSMYLGLTMGVLCQEQIYQGQGELALQLAEDSFVGDSYYQFWSNICGGETTTKTVQVKVPEKLSMPTLMISGLLDPITPEQSAEQALSYLSNVTHLIMPNASHTNSSRGCMPTLINEFLLTKSIADSSCILDNKFPPFAL